MLCQWAVGSIILTQFFRFFLSFVSRVRVKKLHAFVVKGAALLTTKVIMNVIASMEAPRNPAKGVSPDEYIKNVFHYLLLKQSS